MDVLVFSFVATMQWANPALAADTSVNAFDDPLGFMASVHETIDNGKEAGPNLVFFVSTDADDPEPTGSITSPFPTFREALQHAHDVKQVFKHAHTTILVRGGTYYEPLLIGGHLSYGGSVGILESPWLYDSSGHAVKADDDGNFVYDDPTITEGDPYDELGTNYYVAADITVKPYNNETVIIDGGCRFVCEPDQYLGTDPICQDVAGETTVNQDHPDWSFNAFPMDLECSSAEWPTASDVYVPSYQGMITAVRAARIEIRGLEVRNSPVFGISVYSRSQDVIIADNLIDNVFRGAIKIDRSSNLVVSGNIVSRSTASSTPENITASMNNNYAIYNNIVTNSWNDAGIDAGAHSGEDNNYGYIGYNTIYDVPATGIYLCTQEGDSLAHVLVENNVIYNVGFSDCMRVATEGDGTGSGSIEDVIIRNNLCHSSANGIWLGYRTIGGYMDNIHVINNTVYGNGTYGLKLVNESTVSGFVVMNNILSDNGTQQMVVGTEFFAESCSEESCSADSSKLILSNNLTFCDDSTELDDDGNLACLTNTHGGYQVPEGGVRAEPTQLEIAGEVQEDPLFVDAGGDFHLAEGSPAIDAGSDGASVPDFDLDDDARPGSLSESFDIGA
ncbi:MAG: right-handed parallel beta-helix repeat-containing protein, partial [Proteobacteria bacterium]|nr:right-handed parallel beta-helix repeat-containing protein [Pseudomonadota bacterium]